MRENKPNSMNKHVDLSDDKKTRKVAYLVRPYAAIHDVYDDILEFDGFRLLNDVVKVTIDGRDRVDTKTAWNCVLIGLAKLRARLVKINLLFNNYMDKREIEKTTDPIELPDIFRDKVLNFHLQLASFAEELAAGSGLRQRLVNQMIVSHVPVLLNYHLTVGMERLVLRPEAVQDSGPDRYGITRLALQTFIFKELQSEQSNSFQVNTIRYIQTFNIAKTWLLR